jgi:hypothetical protein
MQKLKFRILQEIYQNLYQKIVDKRYKYVHWLKIDSFS